jgi:hypothetical protein
MEKLNGKELTRRDIANVETADTASHLQIVLVCLGRDRSGE